MTTLSVRIPAIDWSRGFDRHWNGGNAGATHVFNALSFLFPQGEQFFIDVARDVARDLDLSGKTSLAEAVKGFVAQESIHRHQHGQYNAVLESQGFENVVRDYIDWLQETTRRKLPALTNLAIVVAYEHYTAVMGDWLLRNPAVVADAAPDMALLWSWHAVEEAEHKAVCFDLYQAADGGWLRRVLAFLFVTANFGYLFGRLYFSLLYRDGCLRPARLGRTTLQALRFFFGRSGIVWPVFWHGIRYLSPWFHPWHNDNRELLKSWLAKNEDRLTKVGR